MNTCSVIEHFYNDFEIVGITTNTKIDVLKEECIKFKPKYVHISSQEALENFKKFNINVNIYEGSIADFVKDTDFDILVNAKI